MLRSVLESFVILLAVGMATPQSTYKKPEKETHTVRIGDVQATVTAAGEVTSVLFRQQRKTPRAGNHFVVVNMKFKNLALYSSCCALEAWLRVEPEFNYSQYIGYWVDPKTYGLQLAEESEGTYLFEVKDGSHLVWLKLVHQAFIEDSCAHSQHRRLNTTDQKDVILSLSSLPEPVN
jgi:hypothetical protein